MKRRAGRTGGQVSGSVLRPRSVEIGRSKAEDEVLITFNDKQDSPITVSLVAEEASQFAGDLMNVAGPRLPEMSPSFLQPGMQPVPCI